MFLHIWQLFLCIVNIGVNIIQNKLKQVPHLFIDAKFFQAVWDKICNVAVQIIAWQKHSVYFYFVDLFFVFCLECWWGFFILCSNIPRLYFSSSRVNADLCGLWSAWPRTRREMWRLRGWIGGLRLHPRHGGRSSLPGLIFRFIILEEKGK